MKKSNVIVASLLVLGFIPAAAFAGECNKVPQTCAPEAQESLNQAMNGQMQFSDSIATLHVVANETLNGTTASGLAVGNSVSVRAQELPLNVSNDQRLYGNTRSFNRVEVQNARGLTLSNSTAQGNAGQLEACCANTTVSSQQIAETGTDVVAHSLVRVGSSDVVISNAQAAANNWALASRNGYVENYNGQYSASKVVAVSDVEACCNNDVIMSGAVAAGNTSAVAGENATIYSTVDQKNYGDVGAWSNVKARSATNVTSAANAVGNAAQVKNSFGYAQLDGYQENSGEINANSEVHLGNWSGSAVSGSSAMGNSAILSNIGSDAMVNMTQNNFGGVSSFSGLYGSSAQGGVGSASSFAVGNAITGFTCAACAGGAVKMDGYASQYNYAPVSATTHVNVGSAGSIMASASAIGNSATFIAQRGGN